MAVVAASLLRSRTARVRPFLWVLVLCAAAGGLYAWMRVPVAGQLHADFAGWCERLSMRPGDWPCELTGSRMLVSYVGGSLLIAAALALPGVLLALSGRRLSALLPAALGGGAALLSAVVNVSRGGDPQMLFGIGDSFLGGGDGSSYWQGHGALAIAADLVLVTVPAVAVMTVLRPKPRLRPTDLPRHAAWAATFVVAGVILMFRLLWFRLPGEMFISTTLAFSWVSVGIMALFGALLGTHRRWWPWALAPVAILLSLGPAMALMGIPSRFTALTWFRGAVPLAGVGLVASLWRPIANVFAGRGRRELRPAAVSLTIDVPSVRPAVVWNALAAGLLVVTLIAVRADPLPVQISMTLPTYLGQRELAHDVRAKQNLDAALDAMESYRATNETYAGFDAAVGEAASPELSWQDGRTGEHLVVGVTLATESHAQVVALSGSGTAFCLQEIGGDRTLGAAERGGLAAARAECGSTSWTAGELRMFDVEAMCDGMDDQVVTMCRAVQRLVYETLATSAPA